MPARAPHLTVAVTGVRSVTHLVYAASWLRHLRRVRPHLAVDVTVTDTGTFLGRSRVDADAVAAYLPGGTASTVAHLAAGEQWVPPRQGELVLVCVGAASVRAAAAVLQARRRLPRVVVVDEGIGSYGDLRTRRAAYLRQRPDRGLRAAAHSSARAAVVAVADRMLPTTRWPLYVESRRNWSVHEEVAAEFRRRLVGAAPGPSSAVYLTQPWPELGVMSEAAYLSHLDDVEKACAARGLALTIRPHPGEDPARYAGMRVSAGSLPAELDRAVTGADVVIGSNSTALLNVAAIHRTRVARVTASGLDDLGAALGQRQRRLLDTFLPPPVPVGRLADALPQESPA